ncbi:MAG: NAD(P)-dependent oxidoreductase [Deltaproteobacteria bacterium]|nr:NAD(P)-dependent oxidoreductase [Deltaproteobacteria bacterium]
MKRVLVTGAAGFLGHHLALALANKGYNLTLCDDFSRGKKDTALHYLDLDLTQPQSFQQLNGPYDAVYHLAAVNGTRYFYEKPDQVLKINLLSTIHLLDWFVASGSKKFLFASTPEAYAGTIDLYKTPLPTPETVPLMISDIQNPRWSYAGSKIAGELLTLNYARQHNFAAHIVRYHNIYGPRMGEAHVIPEFILRALKKENPFRIYGDKHTRSFCYISDAIEATLCIMETDTPAGGAWHIGNASEEIPMLELAKRICRLAQYEPEWDIHPAPEGSVQRRVPDTRKIMEVLKMPPQINLTTGLAKTYEWYLHEDFIHSGTRKNRNE